MSDQITREITLDLLTADSVSVKTVMKTTIDGEEYTLKTTRKAYANSPIGRQQIVDELPEIDANTVLTKWGDTATVTDPEPPVVPEVIENNDTDESQEEEVDTPESVTESSVDNENDDPVDTTESDSE